MAGIATITTLWKQNVLELPDHYGSLGINSFIVKVVQNVTLLIHFVPMLIHAEFPCRLINYLIQVNPLAFTLIRDTTSQRVSTCSPM